MSEVIDPRLALLADRVADAMGLHFPSGRLNDLKRGIAAAARDFGFKDVDSCVEWLLSSPFTQHRTEILAGHLTVGETYLFREKKNLDVFVKFILKEIRDRHQDDRTLRIWSAGCASGEEPYSIAISLMESMPDLAGWKVTILATDINPRLLEKASRGVYGRWSFRQCPPAIKAAYFKETKNGAFEIRPDIKKMVTFATHNLARDVFPSPWNNTDNMDVIFCRNVLMYFAPGPAKAVLEKFHACLVGGGYLIVSPSETSPAFNSRFVPAGHTRGSPIYQKMAKGATSTMMINGPAVEPPDIPFVKPMSEIGVHPALPPEVRHDDAAGPADMPEIMKLARIRANEGKLGEAVLLCQQGIAGDKLNPSHYYLLATILHEQGQIQEAAGHLRRALYLDPDFVLSHFAMGNLMLKLGKISESARYFGNALSLLRKYRPEEVLPDSEGVTVSYLTEVIRQEVEEAV